MQLILVILRLVPSLMPSFLMGTFSTSHLPHIFMTFDGDPLSLIRFAFLEWLGSYFLEYKELTVDSRGQVGPHGPLPFRDEI